MNAVAVRGTAPLPLQNDDKFFIRPIIPALFKQLVFDATRSQFEDKFGLGDIGFDLAYGRFQKNGLRWLVGTNGPIPTATSDAVGFDQWTVGPEVVVGIFRKRRVFAAIFDHRWGVRGADHETSITGRQYLHAFPIFDRTWQTTASPTSSYNHDPQVDQKLTFPGGIGFAKTTRLGQMTWQFAIQYWHDLQQPDRLGQDQLIWLAVTPVINPPDLAIGELT